MIRRRDMAGALASFTATGLAGPAQAAAPRRIVSLNPCLDAILVRVASREQIAAISHYSREPQSTSLGAVGRDYPFTFESAEEIVALRPDLVLTGRHSAPATRAALAKMGVKTELFGVPDKVDESLAQVSRMAILTGHPELGRGLIHEINASLMAAAPPAGSRRLDALVFQAGGFVAGPGTLMDEMLARTGFTNAATRYGLRQTGNVSLERLIADPPDVLLAGQARPGAPTWADRMIEHPALKSVAGRMHRAAFPQRLTWCGGPTLIECAVFLAKARREALERGA